MYIYVIYPITSCGAEKVVTDEREAIEFCEQNRAWNGFPLYAYKRFYVAEEDGGRRFDHNSRHGTE